MLDNFHPYPVEQNGSDCQQAIQYVGYCVPAIAAILFYWIRMKVVQQQTCLRYPVPIVWPIPPVSCCTGCISPVRGSCGRVELFFNSSFINIMHIHEAFKFFLISKKILCFTLYVDCLSLMKIYSMHELFFFLADFHPLQAPINTTSNAMQSACIPVGMLVT